MKKIPESPAAAPAPKDPAAAPANREARRLAAKGPVSAVDKLVEVALRRYAMIEEGDRILLAVSGGKDSMALACDMGAKRRWWPVRYELRPSISPRNSATPLRSPAWIPSWDPGIFPSSRFGSRFKAA
jgi:hypothetical protein